jgi:hypothetical protein
MQEQFRSIYGTLYSSFSGAAEQSQLRDIQPTITSGARAISQSIDEVQARLRNTGLPQLREDAKFLLLTSFTQMVYVPLTLEGGPEAGSITAIIREDIWTIATSAAQGNPPGGEISAHAVLNVLPKVWDAVKAGASRLWEG